jgi:hypothetical protein
LVLTKYVTLATNADIVTSSVIIILKELVSGVAITLNEASEIDGGLFEFIRDNLIKARIGKKIFYRESTISGLQMIKFEGPLITSTGYYNNCCHQIFQILTC